MTFSFANFNLLTVRRFIGCLSILFRRKKTVLSWFPLTEEIILSLDDFSIDSGNWIVTEC